MRSVPLDDSAIAVAGALDVQRSATRIAVRRLPAWTQAQSPEPAFDLMAAMASGVRLVFSTDADAIELDATVTGLQFAGEPRRAVVFDLCAGGERVARAETAAGHTIMVDGAAVGFEAGAPATVRFDGLGREVKRITLYLPHAAMCEVTGLRIPEGAKLVTAPRLPLRWAHYGSSISHGMEAVGPCDTWPAIVARRAGVDLTNLGLAGQCHLDPFVARTLRDGPFDAVSLKIGANVVASDSLRRRTFASAVHGFLDTIHEGKPAIPLLVIAPIHCPLVDDAPGPVRRLPGGGYERLDRDGALEDGALTLAAVRGILSEIVAKRRAAGDANVQYLDGLSLFGAADTALMPDRLHPDGEGHALMAERFGAFAWGGLALKGL